MPAPYSPFVFQIGSFALRWYSLLIVIGIFVAIWLTRREFARRGYSPDLVDDFAYLAVPLGIIGARLYHVFTTLDVYLRDPLAALQIWNGGLGIYGAVIGGVIGVYIMARRRNIPFALVLDAAAPGLIIAQAIGRWGNYFNQEIFGPPTDLPWGLYVDPAYRPPVLAEFERFHPTFLYESIWNLLVGLLLLWCSRRYWKMWRPGTLALLYVAGYSLGRFGLEFLKVDEVLHIGPLRFNILASGFALIVFGAWFLLWLRQAGTRPVPAGPLLEADKAERPSGSDRPAASEPVDSADRASERPAGSS
jgi:prolipoprotein diacylglyceryl transferase